MREALRKLRYHFSLPDVALFGASFLILSFCFYHIYAYLTQPNIGFAVSATDWVVTSGGIDCDQRPEQCLEIGDRVLQIGSLDLKTFNSDRTIPLYRDVPSDPEEEVAITFERRGEVLTRYLNSVQEPANLAKAVAWFFPLLFWTAGTVAIVFLRPRGEQWAVLVLVFYNTALWGAAGFNSGIQVAHGAIYFRVFMYLFLPLLVHLHLILPSRILPRFDRPILFLLYTASLALIVIDLFVVYLHRDWLIRWMLATVVMSVLLLAGRLLLNESMVNRVAHRILLFGFGLGVAPIVMLVVVNAVVPNTGVVFYSTLMGTMFLFIVPVWPVSYLYALYRHSAGRTEFRASRLLSSYGFFTLFITAFVSCFIIGTHLFESANERLGFNLSLALIFVGVAGPLKREFQRQADRRIYGVRYQPDEVVSLFAKRIPGAFNRLILQRVLLDEVLPTLLIRSSALYLIDEQDLDVVYEQEIQPGATLSDVKALRRRCRLNTNLEPRLDEPLGWVRLIVPLATQERVIGFWLLGRRDPDDFYPRSDIELLNSLANQIGPVTENVRLIEMARQEVAENKRLQAQLVQSQKMEAVGRLSAGVAHDFNNILSVILGYSSLLVARYGEDERLAKYLGDIRDAGKRAASLTKQLLAFSRQQVMEAKVMDLSVVVADVEKMLRRLTGEDVELITRLSDELPPVKIDPGQMGQVVMNLAVNARDAMPKGGKLTISTHQIMLEEDLDNGEQGIVPEGEWAVLSVSDTGTGVDAELLSQIFEPYFTTKELGKGTGLGLSMVYGIINQSHGHIEVSSQMGRGTVFRIYLPACHEPTQSLIPEAPRRAEDSAGHETILVVEDEESVRTVACEILRSNGYEVIEASNGIEALGGVKEYDGVIDLLLTDVVMPQMKGTELAEKLVDIRPELRVLYMSGYNEEAILGTRLGESANILIQKPFSPRGLARRVREALDKGGSSEVI